MFITEYDLNNITKDDFSPIVVIKAGEYEIEIQATDVEFDYIHTLDRYTMINHRGNKIVFNAMVCKDNRICAILETLTLEEILNKSKLIEKIGKLLIEKNLVEPMITI